MTTALESIKRWRVFCPRCGDEFIRTAERGEVERIINPPCRRCHKVGVDAVELSP